MMQLFTLYSYIMDGFAYAGEALTGRYVGAHNQADLRRMIRTLFAWGVGLALAFTLLYGIGGSSFLGLLTNEQEVLNASSDYFYWVLAIPLAGMAAFYGMESILELRLPARCYIRCWLLRFHSLFCNEYFNNKWETMPCGWLLSLICSCGVWYKLDWHERFC